MITGTNGFLGRNSMEYFQARYTDVAVPKRQDLDLLDGPAVRDYISSSYYDAVIHCGVTLHSVEENLKMYFNLEGCSDEYGRLLCIGSGAEFDIKNYIPQMREDYFGQYVPSDIYGLSKYVINKDIESIPRNIYNMRVFGIFGKYEDYRRRFISNNICRILAGLDISINTNMHFDYIYVNDFMKILDTLVTCDVKYTTYNICRGKTVDLLSLAQFIKDIHAGSAPINVQNEGLKPEYSGDNSRFLEEFRHFNFQEISESIKELYDWYKCESGLKFVDTMFDIDEYRIW